jgi:hypothetical protein
MKNNNEASKNNNNNVNQIIPRTFLIDATILANTKKSITSHNNTILQASLNQLLKGADGYLPESPSSVVEKTQLPPSGDKHDYLSLSKYWWSDVTRNIVCASLTYLDSFNKLLVLCYYKALTI